MSPRIFSLIIHRKPVVCLAASHWQGERVQCVLSVDALTDFDVALLSLAEVALRGGDLRKVAHPEVQGVAEGELEEESEEPSVSGLRQQGEGLRLQGESVQAGQGGTTRSPTLLPVQRPA